MAHFDIRPCASPAEGVQMSASCRIIVKHPAYSEDFSQNHLLTFAAWDVPEGGLHASSVHTACSLVACNRFDGILTTDRQGHQAVACDNDSILPPASYYFHVPDLTPASPSEPSIPHKYPIYPSFAHWSFPHDKVPQTWYFPDERLDTAGAVPGSMSAVSSAVLARDGSCNLSGCRDILERAHLVPVSETEWFGKNAMHRYNRRLGLAGDTATADVINSITLRADLHRSFDRKDFVIVRKKGQWVVHFLQPTEDLGPEYHNRQLNISRSVAVEFLLARFAWTIFPQIQNFLLCGGQRLVKVRQETPEGGKEVDMVVDRGEAAELIGKSTERGRSGSPKKRKPESDAAQDEEPKRQCVGQTGSSTLIATRIQELLRGGTVVRTVSKPATFTEEEVRHSMMRRAALKAQRPSDPSLVCCDYNAAERASALGLEGPPEFGGGHLCLRCAGVEVMADWGRGYVSGAAATDWDGC